LARIIRLFRVMGFPSVAALESIAAKAGLVKVHYSQRSGRVEIVWLKNG